MAKDAGFVDDKGYTARDAAFFIEHAKRPSSLVLRETAKQFEVQAAVLSKGALCWSEIDADTPYLGVEPLEFGLKSLEFPQLRLSTTSECRCIKSDDKILFAYDFRGANGFEFLCSESHIRKRLSDLWHCHFVLHSLHIRSLRPANLTKHCGGSATPAYPFIVSRWPLSCQPAGSPPRPAGP